MNLAVAQGRVYVADYLTDRVQVFDPVGSHRQAITAEDGFDSPGGVAVKDDGTLLVADTYRHRVIHVAPDGEVMQVWGRPDQAGRLAGQFRYPTDVVLAVFIASFGGHRVERWQPITAPQ